MGSIVAIVGRPNVGKSTLFNRLTESNNAIVDEISGVTRDRIYGKADWGGKEFSVIDTGGYAHGSDDIFEAEIRRQVLIAVGESDVILFILDVVTGITDLDLAVAEILRKARKKVFVVANKSDNIARTNQSGEFYRLGLGEVYPVSAVSGSGTGDLLDALIKEIHSGPDDESGLPRITIAGRPNVGKSSLVNALLGTERNIVTPVAGTTRDAIGTRFKAFNLDFMLVDTAGLRKKGKVTEDLEFYSVLRSIRAIEKCDVCIIMVDAQEGLQAQDMNIVAIAQKNHKGVVIAVNKWDLIKKETNTAKEFEANIKRKMSPFTDVDVLFISVQDKQRVLKVLETALEVYNRMKTRIPTRKLNDLLLPIIQKNPPPAIKGKYVKIKYVTQLPTAWPTFAFFCNLPQYVKFPYMRYLENQLRENFNFTGVTIGVYLRNK